MKGLILMTCLLLASCTSISMQERADELYDVALACSKREKVPVIENGIVKTKNGNPVMQQPEGSCDEEFDVWNEMEEKIIQRDLYKARREGLKCPGGHMAYCDRWCMMDKPMERKMICVRY